MAKKPTEKIGKPAGAGKKPEAKKPEAKKPEAKKPEAKKPEAKKSEAKKPEAKKSDAEAPPALPLAPADAVQSTADPAPETYGSLGKKGATKLAKAKRAKAQAPENVAAHCSLLIQQLCARNNAVDESVTACLISNAEGCSGIPSRSLAWEYLLGLSVYPVETVVQINGVPGSFKSALAFELIRWFQQSNGLGLYLETEHKWSPTLARGIVDPGGTGKADFAMISVSSTEQWQESLTASIQDIRDSLLGTADKPGPGKVVPALFVVDSVAAAVPEAMHKKISTEGSASRQHPINALLISAYIKTLAQAQKGWPFATLLVNHLRKSTNEMGIPTRTASGGAAIGFSESLEVECAAGGRIESVEGQWQGREIRLRVYKNSLAPGDRRITTRLLWWFDETGRQVFVWDWDWALVKLLTDGLEPFFKARLESEGVHVRYTKKSAVDNRAWSANLGMKAADAIPWSQLGARLRQDPAIRDAIRRALGVRLCPVVRGPDA